MLLKFGEEWNLNATAENVWRLLRDTPRLAALLPGVEAVTPIDEPGVEAYKANAHDKIGPFKVTFDMEIRVVETEAPSRLKANIKGADSIGLNRLSGSLTLTLSPVDSSTRMRFDAQIEILGKLAALGAAPIRRRTADKFAEFARNIQAQFAGNPIST